MNAKFDFHNRTVIMSESDFHLMMQNLITESYSAGKRAKSEPLSLTLCPDKANNSFDVNLGKRWVGSCFPFYRKHAAGSTNVGQIEWAFVDSVNGNIHEALTLTELTAIVESVFVESITK